MSGNEVKVLIVIVEIHLHSAFVPDHIAQTACLLGSCDLSVEQLFFWILSVSYNEDLMHVVAVKLSEGMTFHVLVKPFDKFFSFVRFLAHQNY